MSEPNSSIPQLDSKIKSIYIELPLYKFNHSSSSLNNDYYIGRHRSLERLQMLLNKAETCESGTYLVAGYRGMGKTSIVNRAIDGINSKKQYLQINISLSQDDIRDFDVLKLMASQLSLEWLKIVDKYFNSLIEETKNPPKRVSLEEITQRLEYLTDRINAVVKILDYGDQLDQVVVKQKANRLSNQVKENYQARNSYQQEVIRAEYLSKEVERELIYILELMSALRKERAIPQIIFVLDELDKIEPNYFYQQDYNLGSVPSQDELDYIFGSNRVRRRQEVISKLLANLKSFLNTAKAKFIFIGGREMYDSSLADIADRDSFYSSIFHDIIYIESFFKDKVPPSRSGLTRLTEALICKILIPKEYIQSYIHIKGNATEPEKKEPKLEESIQNEKFYSLGVYYHFLIDLFAKTKTFREAKIKSVEVDKQKAIYKLIFFLQNFILFLAYRSNGTPKKIVSILESFILSTEQESLQPKEYLLVSTSAWPPGSSQKNKKEKQLYLKFTFREQYEIGLTANIYRPYVIIHSRYLKSLGDKLLYSSAYIIDYLLKFHTNAFSWRNLELLPEIILVNKDANLRYFISDILEFLSGMYIRETTTGMFQYKFYSKPAHEIKFLTKISETASAAFNFTLDESQHIIRYYRQKLSQLRQAHPNYTHEFIHSISFIESILGDLYYFDKEYDEAIVYYADSIQVLRRMVQQKPHKMTKHQIILYVKNKLHLGLCLEKIKAYDSAYSIYRGLILNTPRVLEKSIEGFKNIDTRINTLNDVFQEEEWDKPIRRMQLFLKPHIALLDLIEKQRMDGITYANLDRNYKEVYDFLVENQALQLKKPVSIGQSESATVQKKMDARRVAVLLSDYYSNVGSMLFYKNRNFSELQQFLFNFDLVNTNDKDLHTFIQSFHAEEMLSHFNPSWSGFTYYYLALRELVSSYNAQIPHSLKTMPNSSQSALPENAIIQATYLLFPECQGIVSKTLLFLFGNLFTRLGDTLLSCFSKKVLKNHPIKESVLALFADAEFDEIHDSRVGTVGAILQHLKEQTAPEVKEQSTSLLSKYCNINTVFLLYRIASLFYHQANKTYSYAFQYKKILFVFKDYLQYSPNSGNGLIKPTQDTTVSLKRIKEISEHIAERIFSANTWMTDVSNRPQVLKYREIFRLPQDDYEKEESRWIYLNLSTSPEIRETIALVEEIKLKLRSRHYRKNAETFEAFQYYAQQQLSSFISPYDLINNRYTRVHELKLQSEINYAKLRAIGTLNFKLQDLLKSTVLINLKMCKMFASKNNENSGAWVEYSSVVKELKQKLLSSNFEEQAASYFNMTPSDDIPQIKKQEIQTIYLARYEKVKHKLKTEKDLEQHYPELFLNPQIIEKILHPNTRKLIQDSIFALFEIIRTLNVYGISYISNHSFLANIHKKLADWCAISLNYDLIQELAKQNGWTTDQVNLRDELKRSQGEEDVHYFEPNYHHELAIQHYSAAIQTHNGGNAYKKLNQTMSFLEDDFNDNLSHFSAASERFRINIGAVQEQLRILKSKIRHSNLYAYDSYVKEREEEWGGVLE